MPRPRVLLIDDSRTAQATLGRGLEEAGYEVLIAGDAREALDVLAQHRVAVVLADYQLPGMTGLDLLAVAARSLPRRSADSLLGLDDPGARGAGPGLRRGGAAREAGLAGPARRGGPHRHGAGRPASPPGHRAVTPPRARRDSLAHRIAQLRQQLGLTQAAFAPPGRGEPRDDRRSTRPEPLASRAKTQDRIADGGRRHGGLAWRGWWGEAELEG